MTALAILILMTNVMLFLLIREIVAIKKVLRELNKNTIFYGENEAVYRLHNNR